MTYQNVTISTHQLAANRVVLIHTPNAQQEWEWLVLRDTTPFEVFDAAAWDADLARRYAKQSGACDSREEARAAVANYLFGGE